MPDRYLHGGLNTRLLFEYWTSKISFLRCSFSDLHCIKSRSESNTRFFSQAEVVDTKNGCHLKLAIGVHHVVRDLFQNILQIKTRPVKTKIWKVNKGSLLFLKLRPKANNKERKNTTGD